MKKELILELFEQLEQAKCTTDSLEYWSAREFQEIPGYAKWDNFVKVINKAKEACENSGVTILGHFPDIGKMVLPE